MMKCCFGGFLEHFPQNPRIFGLEYRLSTAEPFGKSNPFPAALIDAIVGYRYLVQDIGFEPKNILLSGDSAGGNLAFTLAYYLSTYKLPELPQAGGMLLISPTVDWAVTHQGPQSSMTVNSRSDSGHGCDKHLDLACLTECQGTCGWVCTSAEDMHSFGQCRDDAGSDAYATR